MKVIQLERGNNMKAVIIVLLILLTGCSSQKENTEKTDKIYYVQDLISVRVFCDKETNVEYFRYSRDYSNTLTPRFNLDGTLKSCESGK